MICHNCGYNIAPGSKFCKSCGTAVSVEQAEAVKKEAVPPIPSQPEMSYTPEQSAYSKVFIEPDEQLLGTLGNGYLENLLNKKIESSHALLTDKRVYFQGTFFTGSGKSFEEDIVEKIVDLEDITGTGFCYNKPLGILTAIVILIPGIIVLFISAATDGGVGGLLIGLLYEAIAALIVIIKYIKSRQVDFILEYAGGAICFDASIIGLSHVKDFNKQIRRAKDKVKGKK